MKFLTVTCNRDQSQLILQAESIDKFVEDPIEHYIIINEDDPDILSWYKKLKQYYTKHRLILLPRFNYDYSIVQKYSDNVLDNYGWYMQQLQKLLFAYYIQDDYLILDSKDFFLKETHVSIFFEKQIVGNRVQLLSTLPEWIDCADAYAEIFDVPTFVHFPGIVTPYKISHKLITESTFFAKETLAEVLLYPVINGKAKGISEFIFYTYLIPHEHAFWKTIFNDNNINVILPKTEYIHTKKFDNPSDVITNLIEALTSNKFDMCSLNISLLDITESTTDFHTIINSLLKQRSFNIQLTQHSYTNDYRTLQIHPLK